MADPKLFDPEEQKKYNEAAADTKVKVDGISEAVANMSTEVEKGLHAWEKTKEQITDVMDGVDSVVDYTAKLNKLQQKQITDNKYLKQIYTDQEILLKKQFFSEDNLYKTSEKQKQSQEKIKALQAEIEKKRSGVIGINNDKTKEFARIQVELNKQIALERKYGDTVADITNELDAQAAAVEDSMDGVEKKTAGAGKSATEFMRALSSKPIDLIARALGALGPLFKEIVEILFNQNRQVTELQRNLLVSSDEAREMRNRFVQIEASTLGIGSGFTTVKNMLEATSELSAAFGASVDFSSGKSAELVKNQIALTKELGLSGKDAGDLQKTMSMIGMNEEQMGRTVAKSVIESKSRLGVTFNLKNVMADISKLSAATALSLMKNPKSLADAVVKAKELGIETAKMNSMADGLLNIESSLASQFEASILTGKQLNFELAREKALRNDIAGAAADVLRQVGSANDFANMNRIQQEAIAKSVGMSRDELAGSLITQENLNKLGSDAKSKMDELLKGKTEAQKLDIMRNINDDKAALAAAKRVAAQDRMNAMWEKLVSMITNFLAPLEPVLDMLVTAFEAVTVLLSPIVEGFRVMNDLITAIGKGWNKFTNFIAPVMPVLKGIGYAILAILSPVIALAAAFAFMAMASIPFVGPILAAAAALGAISFLTTKVTGIKLAKGGVVMPTEGGTRATIGEGGQPEAVVPLDKWADLTNPKGKQESTKSSGVGNNDALIKEIQKLGEEIKNMKHIIMVDGRELGKTVTQYTSQKVARA